MALSKKPLFSRKNEPGSPSAVNRFSSRTTLYTFIGASGILAVLFLILAIIRGDYPFFILAGSFCATFLLGFLGVSNIWQSSEPIKVLFFSIFFESSIALLSGIFPSYSGFPYAIIAISAGFSLAAIVLRSAVSDWLIYLGLLGAMGSILLSVLAPFTQYTVQTVSIITVIIAVLMALLLVFLFQSGRMVTTLRIKLIFGSLIISMVPLLTLSVINNQYLQSSIQDQSNQALRVAADQTSSTVDDFLRTNLDAIADEASLSSITEYVLLSSNQRSGSEEEAQLKATFQSLQTKEKVYYPSYAILDPSGKNLIDTDVNNIGKSEKFTSYFQSVVKTETVYVSPVEFIEGSRESYISFINPILDENKQIIGFLRMRYDARILQSLIESNIGLVGTRSYPILVDENGLRLADGSAPNYIYRTITQLSSSQYNALINENRLPDYLPEAMIPLIQKDYANAIQSSGTSDFFNTTANIGNSKVQQAGIVTDLTYEPWKVIYIQEQTSLANALQEQNQLSTVIGTIIAGVVGILIAIIANLFTRPIIQLTETSEKISAGDFSLQATVASRDEIGILGNAFNSMTRQLKEFIDSLERRVQERTQQLAQQNESLQFKSRQLQTVSDVAREIVSSRDFESLLTKVTTLISTRFGFYHVGIFLLDEKKEYALLRAANSEGGRRMLDRQHKLQVGQVGIVGYVTGTGEARIATDVGRDAVYFNNPDLPETKSEMALPLIVENQIIGALDVQSTQSDAFSQEDVELFAILADQVAIAINNNQLYAETSKALEASEKTHRQYLNQEWVKQTSEISTKSFKFTPEGLIPLTEEIPDIQTVLETARPMQRTISVDPINRINKSILSVPILLRGETIGVINLQETGNTDFDWSQNELETVQAVADQVALTLENARLFEQTVRRANRERKVLEITSKIRSTNNPQEMLQITLEELRKNLGATKAQIILNVTERETQSLDFSDNNIQTNDLIE